MKFAQASISENKTIHGALGNQNGRELNFGTIPSNYDFIIRAVNPYMRENISKIAIAGVNNNNIGYSQLCRNTLWKKARKYVSIGRIKEPCACDCSSFVSVVVNLAYKAIAGVWLPNYNIDVNACTTKNLLEKLINTGEFVGYAKGTTKPTNGDILLKVGKHTGIVVN